MHCGRPWRPSRQRSCTGFCHQWENCALRGATAVTDTYRDFQPPLTKQSARSNPRLWYRHHVATLHLSYFVVFFQQGERRTRKKLKNQNPASVIVNLNTSSHQYPKGRFCNPRAPTRASELSKERLQALRRHSGGTAHRISHRRQRGGCAREETHTFVMTE